MEWDTTGEAGASGEARMERWPIAGGTKLHDLAEQMWPGSRRPSQEWMVDLRNKLIWQVQRCYYFDEGRLSVRH